MRIEIPEYKTLNIDTIFLDFNGTIAIDGEIPQSVRQRILTLAGNFQIYVLTADTNGTAKAQCEGLPVCLQTFPTGNVRIVKINRFQTLCGNRKRKERRVDAAGSRAFDRSDGSGRRIRQIVERGRSLCGMYRRCFRSVDLSKADYRRIKRLIFFNSFY